jgi:hypothetical protein
VRLEGACHLWRKIPSLVQTAAKIVLEPIFEADFEDSAYGYRPRRSAIDAVKETHRLMCRGYTDVVDADLSKYFDTIPHADLLKSVARRIVDRNVLWLIKLWLRVPVEERDGNGTRRMSGGKSNKRGTLLPRVAVKAARFRTSFVQLRAMGVLRTGCDSPLFRVGLETGMPF